MQDLRASSEVALLLASWAVIGFSGLTSYPDLLRRVQDVVGDDSYTAYIVGLDLGLPSELARTVWLALGLGLLGGIVLLGRRRDERAAFVLAIAAALALTPIVWLHYFALLVVSVAVCAPRLGVVWFVPLAMVMTPGSGHPTPFETAWTLVVASVTVGLAVRASQASSGRGEVAASSAWRLRRDLVDDVVPRRRRHELRSRAHVGTRGLGGNDRLGSRALCARTRPLCPLTGSGASTSGTWCRRSGARRRAGRSTSRTA